MKKSSHHVSANIFYLLLPAFLPVAEHLQHLDTVVQHAFARCGEAYERFCAAVYEDARAEFFSQIKECIATERVLRCEVEYQFNIVGSRRNGTCCRHSGAM